MHARQQGFGAERAFPRNGWKDREGGGEKKKIIIKKIKKISKVRFLATLFRHFCRGHAFTHIKVVEHGVNRTKWSFLKIAHG